jgi:RHS repeat-associated protein
MSYDAWGRRRNPDGTDDAGALWGTIKNTQDHSGYTGHETLDQLALVHMNARLYDPILGRHTSADPTVPDPSNTQSLNRYSYVLNNALVFVDPTGLASNSLERKPNPPGCTGSVAIGCVTGRGKGLFYAADVSGPTTRAATNSAAATHLAAPAPLGADAIPRGNGGGYPAPAPNDSNLGDSLFQAAMQQLAELTDSLTGAPAVGAIPVAFKAMALVGKAERAAGLGTSLAAKEAGGLWSATKSKSAVENALGHWNKHSAEFPELTNSKQYVEAARSLATKPPTDALVKARGADTLIYDRATNTFLVKSADGAPRTMFRPTDGINYWNKQ